MIRHLSYVVCDRCGAGGGFGRDAAEARSIATSNGFERRNWNVRIKDVCPGCQRRAPRIETAEETRNP